jgi:hypothetical protein
VKTTLAPNVPWVSEEPKPKKPPKTYVHKPVAPKHIQDKFLNVDFMHEAREQLAEIARRKK